MAAEMHASTPRQQIAREEARIGFRIHATVTVAVSVLLMVINALTTSFPWAVFPVAGMALGLAIHWYFAVSSHAPAASRGEAT